MPALRRRLILLGLHFWSSGGLLLEYLIDLNGLPNLWTGRLAVSFRAQEHGVLVAGSRGGGSVA